MQQTNSTTNASAATTAQIEIGVRVKMISENSNWEIGEMGTVVWIGDDRVAIEIDGREDDYTAFMDAFAVI